MPLKVELLVDIIQEGNMRKNLIISASLILVMTLSMAACSIINPGVRIVDAKTAASVNENLMPVDVKDRFPEGTSKVSCWFKWRDAKVNTPVLTKWHYVTDDIPVLDYEFNIPKKEGSGSVALTMPGGKKLPQGSYKVDLIVNKRVVRSIKFAIE